MVNPRDNMEQTPLFMAASSGGTDTVELLMEKGADVTMKDFEKSNVLHAAMGHTLTEEALLTVIHGGYCPEPQRG